MKTFVFSIRAILGLIIGIMGLFAIALSLISGNIHRDLVFENQRNVMAELIRFEAIEKLKDLNGISQDLGLSLQSSQVFKTALKAKDNNALINLLNNQFHQYFVTAGVIKLEQLVLFDKNFNVLLKSTEGSEYFTQKQVLTCPQLINEAKLRTGAQRMKMMYSLCLYETHPIHAVIIPIGGLRIKGYIMIATDPIHNLKNIELNLSMPIRLRLKNSKLAYQSIKWPSNEKLALISSYDLLSSSGLHIISIDTGQNIHTLSASLKQLRIELLFFAGVGTLLIALFSIFILRKTMLIPLSLITNKLRNLQSNQPLTGEQLKVTGTKEMHEIINGFNGMSLKIYNLYQSLQQMAYTDSLTKLPNRNQFQQSLTHHIQVNEQLNTTFALFLIDLNRFKSVNDTLGHHIGDVLLKEVSLRLHNVLRHDDILTRLDEESVLHLDNDLVARLGGDEFSAILSSIHNYDDAIIVAKKLVQAMEKPFKVNDHQLIIGLSIGIAMYPKHGDNMHTLVSHADIAMYHAKNNGRGYSIYDVTQNTHSLHNLKLEQELFASIKNNELILYYQPKISVLDRSVVGVEVLIRWKHSTLGLIAPDDFIPIAEQTGFIQPLTLWVLDKALEDCSKCESKHKPSSISINLSALNLRDETIATTLADALHKWSISPEVLTLELTESVIMTDPEFAITILTKLNDMGISLSIDDFGTGHSSLAYVKKLPVNELKIDKSFIQGITLDSDNEAIVRAVLVLAHHMGLSVVAEGVEDIETFEMLRELGCDVVQGFYFAKPMPFDEYILWLEAR